MKSLLLGIKCVSNQPRFANIYAQMSTFQPFEVVGSDSETQLEVAENLNEFI